MERSDLPELHFISRVDNLADVLRLGILSHERADAIPHLSFAMAEVQEKRATVRVPDGTRAGRPLHTYANLYMHARNVTMWARRSDHEDLCVLCVDPSVLDIPGAVITDGNAGSLAHTRYAASPGGLAMLEKERVFTDDWRDPDPFTYKRQRRLRCAEVLIPDLVPPTYLRAIRVSCERTATRVRAMTSTLPVIVDGKLFFR
jgi:hypothetical protein